MSRARRLLELLEILRRHRHPVTGALLSRELGVSLRTLYRDIETLQAQGARIDGAPGLGYLLRPGFLLPPLMLQEEEIEALVLGARWVAERADAKLGAAAQNALAKIGAVLPANLRDALDATGLMVPPGDTRADEDAGMAVLRQAIRAERKLSMAYRDANDEATARVIWPIALAYFDRARVVVAWCELRRDFRHFRVDRIETLELLADKYPRGRQRLTGEWRKSQNLPAS